MNTDQEITFNGSAAFPQSWNSFGGVLAMESNTDAPEGRKGTGTEDAKSRKKKRSEK